MRGFSWLRGRAVSLALACVLLLEFGGYIRSIVLWLTKALALAPSERGALIALIAASSLTVALLIGEALCVVTALPRRLPTWPPGVLLCVASGTAGAALWVARVRAASDFDGIASTWTPVLLDIARLAAVIGMARCLLAAEPRRGPSPSAS